MSTHTDEMQAVVAEAVAKDERLIPGLEPLKFGPQPTAIGRAMWLAALDVLAKHNVPPDGDIPEYSRNELFDMAAV